MLNDTLDTRAIVGLEVLSDLRLLLSWCGLIDGEQHALIVAGEHFTVKACPGCCDIFFGEL